MDNANIIHGVAPSVSVYSGTAGEQVYESLLKYQDLPIAEICAETKRVLSYKNIFNTTCSLADALQRSGISQNSVIAVYSENTLEYFYPLIAALYVGAVAVPINYEYIKSELYHAVNIAKPELVFCTTKTLPNIQELRQKVNFIKKVIVVDLETEIEGVLSLNLFIRSHTRLSDMRRFRPAKFDTTQVAFILYSSGTTGLPKGVMVTHKNLIYRFAHAIEAEFMFFEKPGTAVLHFAPKFHAVGLLTSIESLLLGYRTIVLRKFNLTLFLQCIQDYKIKSTRVFPPIMVLLAQSPLCSSYDLSSLEDIICGAAPLAKEVGEQVRKRIGKNLRIRQAYGLTECTLAATMTSKSKIIAGSSGKVLPHLAVKVVSTEDHSALPAFEPGELWIRGPLVTKGYLNNPRATAETYTSDGWLRTGDIGYYDSEGCFYIIDRLKELIKYKGFQVAPAELEAILLEHPKIKDVGVIGIPSEIDGELPAAFVCIKDGSTLTKHEVIEYVAGQVSSQKQLRGGVYIIPEIPKSISGKILRRKLRDLIKHQPSNL